MKSAILFLKLVCYYDATAMAFSAIWCQRVRWNTMEYHGIRWNTMEYHGIPWNTNQRSLRLAAEYPRQQRISGIERNVLNLVPDSSRTQFRYNGDTAAQYWQGYWPKPYRHVNGVLLLSGISWLRPLFTDWLILLWLLPRDIFWCWPWCEFSAASVTNADWRTAMLFCCWREPS